MNQHKTPPFGSRVLTAVTATLLAFSTSQVVADKPALSASAKYNKKSGVVTIKGKTAKTLPAQSTVSIFDATTANPLYILKTGPKGTFSYSVPRTTPPCTVRVSAGGSEIAIRVAGTGEACRKAPTCSITGPSVTSYTGKADISFAATAKAKKGSSLSYAWSLSDGATSDQASFDHSFANPGNYRADVTVADAATGLSCSDSITVSVAPDLTNAGLPANAVPQADAPSSDPASPEGRKGDKDSFVVLPYDDMGMQGAGSSVNLPYNPYLGYNSLNAQVLKKVEHKPVVLDGAAVSVFYSAGSNPNDPAGAGSVNSTSQNWFADTKEPGSNWDPATSISSPLDAKGNSTNTVERPVDIKFIDGHNYNSDKAVVRKTEMWDHIRSPIDEAIDPTAPRAGISNIDPQNRYIPAEPRRLTHPDEGVVGSSDSAAGRRAMPGIDGPYAKNDPQQISAYNTQSKTFVAQFLPATPVDDKGRINPYPLMRVEAKEGNAVVAKTDAVFSAADEVGCKQCHSKGGIGSDDSIWRTPVTEAELTTADGKPGPATGAGSFPDGANPAAPWPGAIHNPFDGTFNWDTTLLTNELNAATTACDGNTDCQPLRKGYTDATGGAKDTAKTALGKNALGAAYLAAEDSLAKAGTSFVRADADLEKSPWIKKDGANAVVRDVNNLRTDRVAESRWVNMKTPTEICPTKPAADANAGSTEAYCKTAPAQGSDWKLQVRLKFRDVGDVAAGGTTDPNSPANRDKAALFNTSLMHDYMVKYGVGAKNSISSQIADYSDGTTTGGQSSPMYFCSGHHMSPLKLDVGINARAHISNRSDFSRAVHAFHGKMQVYAQETDVATLKTNKLYVYKDAQGADRPAKAGELIRDERGHPKMLGGRGWDSQHNDDVGVPVTRDEHGTVTGRTAFAWDATKNNWIDPDGANTPDAFKRLAFAASLFPVGETVPMEKNCVTCHAGQTQHAYRDTHYSAGLKCDNCHGDMLAVGNVYPDDKFNANLSGAGIFDGESINFRRPWLDEPDCGSCHMGDANYGVAGKEGAFSAGIMSTSWNADQKKSGAWRDPMFARFAVMPVVEERNEIDASKGSKAWVVNKVAQALYRKGMDVHSAGGTNPLTCSSCHGGSHAIWPNPDPNANDNQTAKQLQGFAGNIVDCFVCHIKEDFKTGLVATDGGTVGLGVAQGFRANTGTGAVSPASEKAFLAGPHGIHPVADEYWWKHAEGAAANSKQKGANNGGWHNDMASKPGPDGEDQCAACHGDDHRGTRLSKTLKDREFVNEKGKTVKVAAGTVIGCNLCHNLKKSFTGWENPKAIPKPKMLHERDHAHNPLMMHEPPPPAGLGGGGHSH